ncbi:hypothetical protein [Maritimibacter sp. DP1N21-5]|uniref:hypothetical protein n=1 Tax=Maritimibacter sp. DP1N21-5 TaxID=2836867 RepID=UPI001C46F983|nr:hypothetical protein [Maritimibacter sp. DP1N21-5]MBV7409452.1 hypothetical protein [Maritimibacter sp. DP1N21-5]
MSTSSKPVKHDDLKAREEEAREQTERFKDTDAAGREKSRETSDDISEGMPEKDRDNLDKVTKTD